MLCLQVAVPPNVTYVPLKPLSSTPVKEFPFVLDPFQREAIRCIENSQSVLVSAHTSAGKTVVAEYAIATSLQCTQRVIYTTPIKVCSLLACLPYICHVHNNLCMRLQLVVTITSIMLVYH